MSLNQLACSRFSPGLTVSFQQHFSQFKKSHDGFARWFAQCEVSTTGAWEGWSRQKSTPAPLRAACPGESPEMEP
jgi:hypothetical protein